MTGAVPPPPPGFVLQQPQQPVPPPPPGFVLQSPSPPPAPAAPAPSSRGVPASAMTPEEYGAAHLANTIPSDTPRNVTPDEGPDPTRSLRIGTQAVGRGLADLAGAPADLSTGAANLVLSTGDLLLDTILGDRSPEFMDYRFEPSMLGSNAIADTSADVAELIGFDTIPLEEMTPAERARYEAARFGTAAAASAGGLSAIGSARQAQQAATGGPRVTGDVFDRLARPYVTNPGRTAVADTVGGMGAGAALSFSQDNPIAPDNPLLQSGADLAAMLLGGMVGNVAGAGLAYSPETIERGLGNMVGAGSYTDPVTGERVSRRIMDAAAAALQTSAINPTAARETLQATRNAAIRAGIPEPTPGAATGDAGLRAVEAGQRQTRNPNDPAAQARFEARDEEIFRAVDQGIRDLRPDDADPAEALRIIQDRPDQLRQARDDAALPILEQAYANGARVDVSPVLARLDEMDSIVRRPQVRNVLQQVRGLLVDPATGQPGGDARGIHEARKGINDMIEGRVTAEGATPRYAATELIELRNLLDEAISGTPGAPGPVPEFRQFLDTYSEGSRPLDVFRDSALVSRMAETEVDLRNVAARALPAGVTSYGSEAVMREVMQAIGDDPRAVQGWRAAVGDVLADRITQTRDGSVNYRQLRQVYGRNRDALAEIYTPDEMERLDGYTEVLARIDAARTQARHPGVDNPNYAGAIEAGLLASGYDAVTVGMIMRRARVVAGLLGLERLTPSHKVARVLERAQFDYNLYDMLLERPVAEGVGEAWSRDVRNHLAQMEASRRLSELGAEEEDDDPTISAIMEGAP